MDTAKHTPRPWEAVQERSTLYGLIWRVKQVGTSQGITGIIFPGQDEQANAQLIAASPDLLIAAKGALVALKQNKTYPADIAAAKSFLTYAIAKAEVL